MTGLTQTPDPTQAPWLARPHGRLLVWAIQSPINIGMILRIAEGFQFQTVIYDPRGVCASPEAQRAISDFACGALQRAAPQLVTDADAALSWLAGGRAIATSLAPDAVPLEAMTFARTDTLILGPEYDGLPTLVTDRCDVSVTIPMPPGFTPKTQAHAPIDAGRSGGVPNDGQPNLSVAVAAGILCHRAYLDTRAV